MSNKTKKALKDWKALNDALRTITEKEAEALLKAEQAGLARPTYVKRIHSKFNSLRLKRERKELGKV